MTFDEWLVQTAEGQATGITKKNPRYQDYYAVWQGALAQARGEIVKVSNAKVLRNRNQRSKNRITKEQVDEEE